MKIEFKTQNQQQENIDHLKDTYTKKAAYLMKISIFILIADLFTYVLALQLGAFDFGIFFEIFALIFAILSVLSINKKEIYSSKSNILLSTAPIFLLQLYDIIEMIINLDIYLERFLYGEYYITDLWAVSLILILILNYKSYNLIKKCEKETISTENKNWFYEEL